MIRVLQLPGSISREDGRMSVIMNIYRNLDRNQIQFDFLTASEGKESYRKEIQQLGGKVYLIKDNLSFKTMRSYTDEILSENDYQYIHYHAISPWGCVLDIAHKHNVKVITQSHATEFSEKRIKRIRNRIFSMNIVKDSDKLVAVSPEAGEKLFGKHPFEYIPTWIDKDKYKFSDEKRKQIRMSLGLTDCDILIGHVGRFDLQKNHKFLIQTFEKMVNQNTNYHLMLIGNGNLKSKIENYIKENKIRNVHLIGVTNKVADHYSAMDIFWLPSLYEGLPTVSLEAQANGLPVIASNKITHEIRLGNVFFLPIDKFSQNKWIEITQKKNKLRDQNIDQEFEQSAFNRKKVITQWKKLYGLRSKSDD
ncbi:glycosyltransferase [Ligilactobacillus cholophilus]|uniref:glycosyltransferase n=1 Tax=Ligilactobacillus cholophilus TaxID=3050131 RepID=UPI0025B0CAB8|nr:glycosyltransferase [Ligilactobacillus cholophilus]